MRNVKKFKINQLKTRKRAIHSIRTVLLRYNICVATESTNDVHAHAATAIPAPPASPASTPAHVAPATGVHAPAASAVATPSVPAGTRTPNTVTFNLVKGMCMKQKKIIEHHSQKANYTICKMFYIICFFIVFWHVCHKTRTNNAIWDISFCYFLHCRRN